MGLKFKTNTHRILVLTVKGIGWVFRRLGKTVCDHTVFDFIIAEDSL